MELPKELTAVTSFSKILAAILFVALPFAGFFLGIRYQEMLNLAKSQENEANLSIPRVPTPSPAEALAKEGTPIAVPTADPSITANWKTYENDEFGFEVRYPESWDYREYSAGDPLQLYFYTSSIGNLSRRVYDTTPPDDPSIPQPLEASIVLHVDFGTFDRCPCLEGPRNIIVGGMPAKRMKFPTVEIVEVTKNEYTFSLLRETIQRPNTDNSISSENAMAIFDQIVSTFRFVE